MLEDLKPPSTLRSCRLRTVLDGLEEGDQKILREALDDAITWSTNGLRTALNARGIPLTRDSIDRHRKKICSCSRT